MIHSDELADRQVTGSKRAKASVIGGEVPREVQSPSTPGYCPAHLRYSACPTCEARGRASAKATPG